MTETAQLPTDRWSSIDDALGPAAGRYFGMGYKRTSPTIGQVHVRHDAQASTLDGHGSVSTDKLSTTDAVALVTEALVGLMAARYSPQVARETRMIALDLRASAKPLESTLDDFPVHARLSGHSTGGPPAGSRVTGSLSIEASVGCITAVGQVVRPTGAGSLLDVDSAECLPSLFGVGEEAPYQGHTVALTGVTSRGANEAEAAFEVTLDRADTDESTDEVGFIDAFVGALQLGQLLLCRLDGLDQFARASQPDTLCLWTRRTSFRAYRSLPTAQRSLLHARLGRPRIVRLEGRPWRCADIVAGVDDALAVTCSVGHRLPDTHQV